MKKFLWYFLLCSPSAFGFVPAPAVPTALPASEQNPYWAGKDFWNRRHKAKLDEIAKGPRSYDCVFIGDSITHNWEGWSDPIDVEKVTRQYSAGVLKFPNGPGRRVWHEMCKRWNLLNLGIGGDCTQHVLWRMDHGELDGYKTRFVMLMIGANNDEPERDVVAGIKMCIEKIFEKHPESRILLSPIFPSHASASDPRRLWENHVNTEIRKFADGVKVIWVDFNARFLTPDGTLTTEVMPDLLHPLEPGYRIWREAVEPFFSGASAVWIEGAEKEMNAFYGFAAEFEAKAGDDPVLAFSAASIARVYVNGTLADYGPARAPEGYCRIDRRPLGAFVRDGWNVIAIEVSNSAVNQFYLPEREAFLFAEVRDARGRVLAATGRDFRATDLPRVRRTSRFSYQRGFSEFYRVNASSYDWRTNGVSGAGLPLVPRPLARTLERGAPYPTLEMDGTFRPALATKVRRAADRALRRLVFSVDVGQPPCDFIASTGVAPYKGYREDELEVNMLSVSQLDVVSKEKVASSVLPRRLGDGEGLVLVGAHDTAGFPRLEVECRAPTVLWLLMDEFAGKDGLPDPFRPGNCINACGWRIESPGTYVLEGFQANCLGCVHVVSEGGEVLLKSFDVRTYMNPQPGKARFRSSDPALDRIFAAAARSLANNAVDVFTDCPGRERGVYFGDTTFTGRGGDVLLGDLTIEGTLFENYALASSFRGVPEGMIPMCYPGDAVLKTSHWIAAFGLWSVIELEEYLRRSGDRATVEKYRERALGILRWFRSGRNSDGLLEKLPGWVFVEWSKSSEFTDGVNYPTNMIYVRFLEALANLYGLEDCRTEAASVRAEVRRQAWDGEWFCDHAVRNAAGALKRKDDCTEVCQTLAFFSGVAMKETHPELWKRFVEDLGPCRKKGVHEKVWPANLLFGFSLRFGLLVEAGEHARVLNELKTCFLPQAERTGTLWEGTDGFGDVGDFSACHGFPCQAAWVIARATLGLQGIDRFSRTLELAEPVGSPLSWCEGAIPLPGGMSVEVKVTSTDGQQKVQVSAPKKWTVRMIGQ